MIFSGKQSGRQDAVKRNGEPNDWSNGAFRKSIVAFTLLCSLAACTASVGGWRQANKNEASTRADYAQCRKQAEETTLILRHEERPGFGTESAERPGPFNPRGDNTMAISERSDATNLQDALVASCMSRKGYSRPAD
ncbi:MAG: hypothetical protein RIF37_12025 [Rhodospirillaceae bacterium]